MKKVLILTASAAAIQNSAQSTLDRIISRHPDSEIEFFTSAFEHLDFFIDGGNTSIRDNIQGFDLAGFDLVVFRGVGNYKEEMTAVITYLDAKKIKYFDTNSLRASGKLARAFGHWAAELPIPRTAYGTADGLKGALSQIGLPAVLKDTKSNKGNHNYLIHTADELHDKLANYPDRKFLLQQFIPNDGDYRILVVNFDEAIVSLRQGDGSTHLNNVSAGGTETLITDTQDLESAIDLALITAKVDNLRLAGVDVITDKNTGKHFILEDNHFPQVTMDVEIDGFYNAVKGAL